MNNTYYKEKEITLAAALDRIIDKGAVITGDIKISVADVDLIYLGLRVVLSSVETMERHKVAAFKEAS